MNTPQENDAPQGYQPIPVAEAKSIGERYGKHQVVILAYDPVYRRVHTTSYGRAPLDKEIAAHWASLFATAIGCDLASRMMQEGTSLGTIAARLQEAAFILDAIYQRQGVSESHLKHIGRFLQDVKPAMEKAKALTPLPPTDEPPYQTRDGIPTTKDNPQRMMWYGTCTYWTDDWSKLSRTRDGIPCCPNGHVGFQTTWAQWFDGAKILGEHYLAFLNEMKEKCIPGRHTNALWDEYKAKHSIAEGDDHA